MRILTHILAALVALALVAAPASAQAPASSSSYYDGAQALGLALRRLGTTGRVLMIGAHPDDESTSILATLALGRGADVAYLSLTRGEGGQNRLGPELEEALGLIRTEELLAARRRDGAVQFFTRAYDFGYSKTAAESFRHWPRDSLLADVVRVIRTFRPNVVISVFSGTPRDGHGHHQVAGILAREAWRAAGDPDRFPAQLKRGLRPHAPAKLYYAPWRPSSDETDIVLQTGEYDPLLGRSYYQIAMAGRSRHRSQGMGQLELPGPHTRVLQLVDERVEHDAGGGVFAGVETTLDAFARGVDDNSDGHGTGEGAKHDSPLQGTLAAYESVVDRVRAAFNPLASGGGTVSGLAQALGLLRRADALAAGRPDLRFRIGTEMADVRAALTRAAGLSLHALAADARVVPGQTFELELTLWNGGDRPIAVQALRPAFPAGWEATPLDPAPSSLIQPGALATRRFRVRVPRDARPTEPYYLRRPRNGALYRWPADPALAARPFQPPPVHAMARIQVAGAPLTMKAEATRRIRDRTLGELHKPLLVVPAVSLALEPRTAVLRTNAEADSARAIRFTVRVTGLATDGTAGTLRLRLPDGWHAEPRTVPIRFDTAGERHTVRFTVHAPADAEPGRHAVRAVFTTADDERYTRGYDIIDYPHIRPRPLYSPARATVRAFEVRVPKGLRVGYVTGVGDAATQALAQLGVDYELLGTQELATGDLSGYDVIVTGSRAYEFREDLARHNERLLDWVREGGTLIVQYNKYPFDEGGFAPYPLTMAHPHDRVTDEHSPVRLLRPDHPALSTPNDITLEDFEGWVQERGLYFAHTWDERYTPLLALRDPGEEWLRGGLLVAPLGEGTYVYTGLAFFRQLPAGVAGAYRLFANLLALGAK